MRAARHLLWVALLSPGFGGGEASTGKAQATQADRMHARAVELFRQARFSEAYGRFIELANAGHPASARYALWMCEQGPALFGKDWDCAPYEIDDWAWLATVARPSIAAGPYNAPARPGRPAPR